MRFWDFKADSNAASITLDMFGFPVSLLCAECYICAGYNQSCTVLLLLLVMVLSAAAAGT
jgi:hypothetical protein